MIITYNKIGFIKIVSGDTTIAVNPISKESKTAETKFGADIVLISLNDPDCNGIKSVARAGKSQFIIDGPGEYEVKNIFIKGVHTTSNYNDENKINTMYSIHIEDLHILYLGAISIDRMTTDMLDGIDDIDILFIPISGENTLDSSVANKIANSLEVKIIIPICYTDDSLSVFLKESGVNDVDAIEKMVVKKKDTENKTGEIVVLSSN